MSHSILFWITKGDRRETNDGLQILCTKAILPSMTLPDWDLNASFFPRTGGTPSSRVSGFRTRTCRLGACAPHLRYGRRAPPLTPGPPRQCLRSSSIGHQPPSSRKDSSATAQLFGGSRTICFLRLCCQGTFPLEKRQAEPSCP
jgi:hypothetical protein